MLLIVGLDNFLKNAKVLFFLKHKVACHIVSIAIEDAIYPNTHIATEDNTVPFHSCLHVFAICDAVMWLSGFFQIKW